MQIITDQVNYLLQFFQHSIILNQLREIGIYMIQMEVLQQLDLMHQLNLLKELLKIVELVLLPQLMELIHTLFHLNMHLIQILKLLKHQKLLRQRMVVNLVHLHQLLSILMQILDILVSIVVSHYILQIVKMKCQKVYLSFLVITSKTAMDMENIYSMILQKEHNQI